MKTHTTVSPVECPNSQPVLQEYREIYLSMSSHPSVVTQQVTPGNSCLNSHGPTKAAAESDKRDGNPESNEAPVTIVLESSVLSLKDQELEEDKIKIFLTHVLTKYLEDDVQ
jgi:hypothetical protein